MAFVLLIFCLIVVVGFFGPLKRGPVSLRMCSGKSAGLHRDETIYLYVVYIFEIQAERKMFWKPSKTTKVNKKEGNKTKKHH